MKCSLCSVKNKISVGKNIFSMTGCICDVEKNMQINPFFRKFGTVFAERERERASRARNLFKNFYISKPDIYIVAVFLCFCTMRINIKNFMPMMKQKSDD